MVVVYVGSYIDFLIDFHWILNGLLSDFNGFLGLFKVNVRLGEKIRDFASKTPPNRPQTIPNLSNFFRCFRIFQCFFRSFDSWGQPRGPLQAEGRPWL